ncbi:hypothetical protein WJX73_004722 [Symbiochloris irregularis]|uniref:Uncharacterized protein n=1 Tax=Symbiochloris irregularis TaxID=706552 RepID=A0AAW1NY11_9CHLO
MASSQNPPTLASRNSQQLPNSRERQWQQSLDLQLVCQIPPASFCLCSMPEILQLCHAPLERSSKRSTLLLVKSGKLQPGRICPGSTRCPARPHWGQQGTLGTLITRCKSNTVELRQADLLLAGHTDLPSEAVRVTRLAGDELSEPR